MSGDGTGGFVPSGSVFVGGQPGSLISGDFNQDGHADLAVACYGSNNIAVLIGDGVGGFNLPQYYPTGAQPTDLKAADIDENGHIDLVAACRNCITILLGAGDGSFLSTPGIAPGSAAASLVVSDLDLNGHLDLVVGSPATPWLSLLYGDGTGAFSSSQSIQVSCGPVPICVVDANEDGRPDLVAGIRSPATGCSSVASVQSDGAGGFMNPRYFETGSGPVSVACADLDEDSHQDLVSANFDDDTLSILRGDGTGAVSVPQSIPIGDGPRFLIAADFNEDGHADLAALSALDDNLWVLRNTSFDPQACRSGNVNAAVGPIVDVLLVNGTAGSSTDRLVMLAPNAPVEIRMLAPPSNPTGPARFALYGWLGIPTARSVTTLPFAIGQSCMPMPLNSGVPTPLVTWNNVGLYRILGTPTKASTPAPTVIIRRERGVRRSAVGFVQGLVEDSQSFQGQVAVTNGVLVMSQ